MDHHDSKLEQAREELAFWQDYVAWWERERGTTLEPRAHEALALAEQRLRDACRRRDPLRLLSGEGPL